MSGAPSLVPDGLAATPDHWCTWAVQGFEAGRGVADWRAMLDAEGGLRSRNALHDRTLFGPGGWLERFHPRARRDLLVILDDGWDLPLADGSAQTPWYGWCEAHPDRFAGAGDARERLAAIDARVRGAGWRGVGLWICAQEAPRAFAGWGALPAEREAYWAERLRTSHAAGVRYWKVDWGKQRDSEEFRRMLTRLAREHAPGLVVEHTVCRWPLNDWQRSGRMSAELEASGRSCIAYSDCFRTYDVLVQLSVPTTLERVGRYLACARPEPGADGLIHCEDEPAIGAALGCVIGAMRYAVDPADAAMPNLSYGGARFEPTRPLLASHDEVARTARWRRIAPAFGCGGDAAVDAVMLADAWDFEPGESWFSPVAGSTVVQRAPARIVRGLPLPEVRSAGEPPYVVAARFPGGAVAVAALGRVEPRAGHRDRRADVALDIGDAAGPVGVFGRFAALRLRGRSLRAGMRLIAQDLLAGSAEDVTSALRIEDGCLTLPGPFIERVGLAAATPGDGSPPGLVLAWR